jgi:hypothetical protein
MAPKRIIGDVRDEWYPGKEADEARWRAKNMNSSKPSLGASRWNEGKPQSQWSLETTRDEIFGKMAELEGKKELSPEEKYPRVNAARGKVYEDMCINKVAETGAGATVINVEYCIDAILWTDHGERARLSSGILPLADLCFVTVWSRNKQPFPWAQPGIHREDAGYAAFVSRRKQNPTLPEQRGSWSGAVLSDDEARRAQWQQEQAGLEKKMKAEGKKWEDMAPQVQDKWTSTQTDKDGNRVHGQEKVVIHGKPAAAEAAKEKEKEKEEKAELKKTEAEPAPWSPEEMTKLYDEIFGRDGARLDGMAGFELPFEKKFAGVVWAKTIAKAKRLFPATIEMLPKDLGWDRFKICLRFVPWVVRGPRLFPLHKSNLVWAWCVLLEYKKRLIQQAADDQGEAEPSEPLSLYEGIRGVIEEWTERTATEKADLSVVSRAWDLDAQADRDGLEDEATKQRLYDAVSKVVSSSRKRDDVSRAHRVVNWAEINPEELGGRPRTRTYLAIEAMIRYCESTTGEEALGRIARHMMAGEHGAASRLKKRAVEAANSS